MAFEWHPRTEPLPPEALEGVERIIHLMGEPLHGPATRAARQRIAESRRTAAKAPRGGVGAAARAPDRGLERVGLRLRPGSGCAAAHRVERRAPAEGQAGARSAGGRGGGRADRRQRLHRHLGAARPGDRAGRRSSSRCGSSTPPASPGARRIRSAQPHNHPRHRPGGRGLPARLARALAPRRRAGACGGAGAAALGRPQGAAGGGGAPPAARAPAAVRSAPPHRHACRCGARPPAHRAAAADGGRLRVRAPQPHRQRARRPGRPGRSRRRGAPRTASAARCWPASCSAAEG